jgi:peptidoglycan/LPS O-acetylase OafA/YrhL
MVAVQILPRTTAPRTCPNSSNLEQSPNLDLLRSIAVLCVLVDHIFATFGYAQRYEGFFDLGRLGVLLFFVHTSFVLMMSLERHQATGTSLYGPFYLRRAFRIYPLSVLAITVALTFHIPAVPWVLYEKLGTLPIWTNYLLCQNLFATNSVIAPLWSLPYEVQMYLTLPFFYLICRKSSYGRLALLWVAAVLAAWAQGQLATIRGFGLYRLDLAQFVPCFLAGIIAYRISLKGKCFLPWPVWPAAILLASTAFVCWHRLGSQDIGRFPPYRAWFCCILVGLIVPFCRESRFPWLNRVTHYIAKYSYGVYLAQVPIIWLAFVRLAAAPMAVRWIICLALLVAVPFLSFHVVEHPMIKLGSRLTRKKKTPAVQKAPAMAVATNS